MQTAPGLAGTVQVYCKGAQNAKEGWGRPCVLGAGMLFVGPAGAGVAVWLALYGANDHTGQEPVLEDDKYSQQGKGG
jgi:hypothetical protein